MKNNETQNSERSEVITTSKKFHTTISFVLSIDTINEKKYNVERAMRLDILSPTMTITNLKPIYLLPTRILKKKNQ